MMNKQKNSNNISTWYRRIIESFVGKCIYKGSEIAQVSFFNNKKTNMDILNTLLTMQDNEIVNLVGYVTLFSYVSSEVVAIGSFVVKKLHEKDEDK